MIDLSAIIGWAEHPGDGSALTVAAFTRQAVDWAEGMDDFETEALRVRRALSAGRVWPEAEAAVDALTREYAEYVLIAGYADEDDQDSRAMVGAAETVVRVGLPRGEA